MLQPPSRQETEPCSGRLERLGEAPKKLQLGELMQRSSKEAKEMLLGMEEPRRGRQISRRWKLQHHSCNVRNSR